jgi:hypothetical protein
MAVQIPLGYSARNARANPTLIPNLDRPVIINGVLSHIDPADLAATSSRVNATATATIGGTVTVGNVVTLTVTIGSNVYSFPYTVVTGDTVDSIANQLANLINNADDAGISASAGGEAGLATVTVQVEGPIGNHAVLSATSPGTETVTLNPSNGALSGGGGPVIAYENFNYVFNGQSMSFFAGQVYQLGDPMLSKMVAQGMPIV